MNWLLLIHQIPAKPSYFRAKIWRRLQQVGAVPIKQAVYVMPCTEHASEALGWIAKEIIESGGEAVLVEAEFRDGLTDEQVIDLFQKARREDYQKILEEAETVRRAWNSSESSDALLIDCKESLSKLRKAFGDLKEIDFYPGNEQSQVEAFLVDMETILRRPAAHPAPLRVKDSKALVNKAWVTQANVYVDRMASAWFIRRFIDSSAKLKFVKGSRYKPQEDEIRYDMVEAEYTHLGELCTFEVLVQAFAREEPALQQLAKIIHDIDLKDDAFGLAETPGIKALFDGIVSAESDDSGRVARASAMLDELFAFFKSTTL